MQQFPTIYKRDSKGKVREWRMEVDGDRYRTVSGLQDGEHITTEWTVAEGKNTGRANATTPEQQAVLEVESQYEKKLKVDYHENQDDIDNAKIYKPMLAKKWEDRRAKIDWKDDKVHIQPKLDGIRCIAMRQGLFSRTGKPIVAVPHIFEQLNHCLMSILVLCLMVNCTITICETISIQSCQWSERRSRLLSI